MKSRLFLVLLWTVAISRILAADKRFDDSILSVGDDPAYWRPEAPPKGSYYQGTGADFTSHDCSYPASSSMPGTYASSRYASYSLAAKTSDTGSEYHHISTANTACTEGSSQVSSTAHVRGIWSTYVSDQFGSSATLAYPPQSASISPDYTPISSAMAANSSHTYTSANSPPETATGSSTATEALATQTVSSASLERQISRWGLIFALVLAASGAGVGFHRLQF
jgi:hypothetical protein